VKLRRGTVRIAGMTKGSGMIQPLMATTLGFVMTDADIPPELLRAILKRSVERSYNRLSVDGDTSTNDTLLLLANGASGVRPDPSGTAKLEEAVARVMESLAQAIARDGEGARKFVTIRVTGAASDDGAARIARAIANSPLVKTAIAGSDPNWGRILSAAGNAGVAFDPSKTDIRMQQVLVCRGGLAAAFSEAELKRNWTPRSARSWSPSAERAKARRGSGRATSPRATSASTPVTDLNMTRRWLLLLPLAACLRADSEKDARDLMASLAGALSAGKVELFLDAFDPAMPDFDKLRFQRGGLTSQADVSCNIEIASNEGDDSERTLTLDWILIEPSSPGEKTVKCRLKKVGKKWKIVSFAPVDLFAPAGA
jgi:hypothetical protein